MSIFSKIISGEIPAYKIAENEHFIAFLDVMPAQEGHTLVVSKLEVDRLFDLPDENLDGLLVFAKPIANAIRKVVGCNRVNIATIGFEVPHAHVHLVPMNSSADADIISKKLKPSPEALKEIQAKIIAAL